MRFEIVERDGLARTGILEIEGHRYATPTVCFIKTSRYSAPDGQLHISREDDAKIGDIVLAPSAFEREGTQRQGAAILDPGFRGSPYCGVLDDSELKVVGPVSPMLLNSAEFVEGVASAKKGENLLKPQYCSLAGLPNRLAFLAYCGLDIFDSIPLIMSAENGLYLTTTGVLDYQRLKELPCSCPACASGKRNTEALLSHNYTEALNELRLVRHTISEGRLRELVENRVRTDPWLVQNLRLMDLEQHQLQERHCPIRGSSFHAGSKESLSRPDVVRWRMRLKERYRRPESAKVLVLIPCSARKPYSMSITHRRFREAILASGTAPWVHEVIVTSPLGIVPRELELFYPAKDYDIPVTGHWDSDEKAMIAEMVEWLLESQQYEFVVSHLGDERELVGAVLREHVDTSQGRPSSSDSLQRLTDVLREIDSRTSSNARPNRLREDMRSLCEFQFGSAGSAMCDEVEIRGKWPNLRIVREGQQLGMLTGERGMVSLTLAGAHMLARENAYCVEIDDFIPRGNLFAVGVEKASPEIRIGDDVAVVHKGEVRAVGVAQMTPQEMELAERGEAVHIRHAA